MKGLERRIAALETPARRDWGLDDLSDADLELLESAVTKVEAGARVSALTTPELRVIASLPDDSGDRRDVETLSDAELRALVAGEV